MKLGKQLDLEPLNNFWNWFFKILTTEKLLHEKALWIETRIANHNKSIIYKKKCHNEPMQG